MNTPAHRYGAMIGLVTASLVTGCATTAQRSADSHRRYPNVTVADVTAKVTSDEKIAVQSGEAVIVDAQQDAAVTTPVNSDDTQVANAKDKAATTAPQLDRDTKRMILSWATHSLIRAQTMMHGSDDVSLIVDAAMDQNDTYRSKLADHLIEQGITEQSHEQAMAKIEKHIRSTTRDFVLQARTLLKRENKSMPMTPKSDVMI